MAAGADQPRSPPPRQMIKPLPNCPPTMKAPFFNPGTITAHCAFSTRSRGIPLSPAAISSESTVEASVRRSAAWLRSFSLGAAKRHAVIVRNPIVLRMSQILLKYFLAILRHALVGRGLLVLDLDLVHHLIYVRNGGGQSGDSRALRLRIHLTFQYDHPILDVVFQLRVKLVCHQHGIQ